VGEPFKVNDRELQLSTNQMWYEINQLKDDWPSYIYEKLHKVAYRQQGLANTLLSPKYAIGKHKASDIEAWADRYLVTGNATLVATGVDHEDALKFASSRFLLAKGPTVSPSAPPKFYAGDARKQRPNAEHVVVYLAAPAPGLTDVKGTTAYALLTNLLGTGPLTSWSDGGQNRLARAARKAVSNPFYATATNCPCEDGGIFSLFYSSYWQDSATLAKALVGEVRALGSAGPNEKDLQAAKNRLKCQVLLRAENDDALIEDLGVQAVTRQADIHLAADQTKLIDSVSAADIQQAAKQLVSGKFALAAIGRLDKTPYLDELLA